MYVDAATPLNAVFTVKIIGPLKVDSLTAALLKIQQKHPLLSVSIDESEKDGPHFLTNKNILPIPVRVEKRLSDEQWLLESKKEWHRLFDAENEPLMRMVWLRSADVSELLLVLPHCICDGTTCVALMNELLALLDDPEMELPAYQSFSSVDELMPAGFVADKKKKAKAKLFAALGKVFFLLKATRGKKNEGADFALHWSFNEQQTKDLVSKCKANDTSVHAALCTAFMQAFGAVSGDKAHGKVISPVDIRRFISDIKHDTMFAFAPIAELTIDKKANPVFWEMARQVKADLNKKIEAMQVHEQLWMGERLHGSVNKMIGFLRSTDGTHDLTLSNMGRLGIPEQFKSFEVSAIYSPTVAFPWRNPNTLVVSTFKNQMSFSLMSNESFLKQTTATGIKEEAMEILLSA